MVVVVGWAKTWHISYTQDFEYKIYIAKGQNKVIYITSAAVAKITFESTGQNSILVHAGWYLAYVLSLHHSQPPTSPEFIPQNTYGINLIYTYCRSTRQKALRIEIENKACLKELSN